MYKHRHHYHVGMPFIVRNHALGNNPCYPYDGCMATHMGDDLDILTWEQVYVYIYIYIYTYIYIYIYLYI
jgi:hypothetical protein